MKFQFDTTKLKEQVEDNPLVAAGIAVMALTGVTKLMNANTARKNAHTYAKEVNRRIKNAK
jgi:hypothetical protein